MKHTLVRLGAELQLLICCYVNISFHDTGSEVGACIPLCCCGDLPRLHDLPLHPTVRTVKSPSSTTLLVSAWPEWIINRIWNTQERMIVNPLLTAWHDLAKQISDVAVAGPAVWAQKLQMPFNHVDWHSWAVLTHQTCTRYVHRTECTPLTTHS